MDVLPSFTTPSTANTGTRAGAGAEEVGREEFGGMGRGENYPTKRGAPGGKNFTANFTPLES